MAEKQTFARGIEELEAIVRDLEGGKLELEESLARYERGVTLIKELQVTLETAQQKVTTLLGDVEPAPATGEEVLS
ncbi:MAG: exodeoxyribonuclease VII small subunit [Coriobacteriia bacterium]|nr:exodeoxyribonuclease VII small subunit [Coriobacteriia bacterium]